MKVYIPDHAPVDFPETMEVEQARKILEDNGYTTVVGARATRDANGDIRFERNAGGAKASR